MGNKSKGETTSPLPTMTEDVTGTDFSPENGISIDENTTFSEDNTIDSLAKDALRGHNMDPPDEPETRDELYEGIYDALWDAFADMAPAGSGSRRDVKDFRSFIEAYLDDAIDSLIEGGAFIETSDGRYLQNPNVNMDDLIELSQDTLGNAAFYAEWMDSEPYDLY